jgi:hypothetical protein
MSRAMSAGMSCEQVCMQSHFCVRFPRKSETRQNYFAFEVWRERDLLFLCCLAWKQSQTYFLAPVRNRFATACRVIEVGSLLIFLSFLILDEPGDNIISDQINQVIKLSVITLTSLWKLFLSSPYLIQRGWTSSMFCNMSHCC